MNVSVVIPTIGRGSLADAVESVLAQTHPITRVFVVADTDGPIDLPDDERVRLLRVGPRAGGNVARNRGIEEADTDLIALLDDDDTWHPTKIEDQLKALPNDLPEFWASTSLVVDTDGVVRPERLLSPSEEAGDYLFTKTRIRGGVGKIHTSTLLFPKRLGTAFPFDSSLKFHQDVEWLSRLSMADQEFRLFQLTEARVTCGDTPGSVAKRIPWKDSAAWAKTHLAERPRWHGDFLLETTLRLALGQDGLKGASQCFSMARETAKPGAAATLATMARLVVARAKSFRERS